jgi:hypothetical protein
VAQTIRAKRSVTEQPIYWIYLLEDARARGDRAAAAATRRELARLGVRVIYGRRRVGVEREEARNVS